MKINDMAHNAHANALNKGWWGDPSNPDAIAVGEKIALMHSELSEALEEWRDGRGIGETYYNPGKPTKPEGVPSELADVVIRIGDFCARAGIDLDAAIAEKMAYNATRPHRHGGKLA